jgi:chemotaxis protein MotB
MGRRKPRHEEPENHDRWLVSYADFITLLFAFFVVMYAISQVNEGKYRVLSDALLQAFTPDGRAPPAVAPPSPPAKAPPSSVAPPAPPTDESPRGQANARMKAIARDVLQALEPLVKEGQVRVSESPLGISVEINASVLFKSAQAELESDSVRALTAVARVLAGVPNQVQVQGHTDNAPIATPQFPSNWELSGARASSVVRLFIASGVPPERLVALGYAETRPMEANATLEGRSRNRRVTVMILPENAEEKTPVSVLEPGKSQDSALGTKDLPPGKSQEGGGTR